MRLLKFHPKISVLPTLIGWQHGDQNSQKQFRNSLVHAQDVLEAPFWTGSLRIEERTGRGIKFALGFQNVMLSTCVWEC